ncbi:VanW like protein [Salsuginibacillus halophilus]|uniref:VanW like protein n=1 Tax=Salsuginibacillus halophilus TaxID=517424 RepID=A0A2P8HCL9_9BACI|nr:VanW family protein [Salsuginibacillus halophilus]PSL43983.1 VanW like protein [Salsuginibacillus halophilus]
MNRRYFLQALALKSAIVLFILGFTYAGTAAYDRVLVQSSNLPENAEIAGIELGGASLEEAEAELEEAVHTWQRQALVDFVMYDEDVQLETEVLDFQIEEAFEEASATGSAELRPRIAANALQSHLEELPYQEVPDQVDIERLQEAVSEHVRLREPHTRFRVTNYFSEAYALSEQELRSTTLQSNQDTPALEEWADALDGTEIEPRSSFHFSDAMDEAGIMAFENIELQMLASGIFQVLSETNFVVTERHIHRELPDYAALGEDARVIPGEKELIIYNPNYQPYELQVSYTGGELFVALRGEPFLFNYERTVRDEVEVEPRTVVHYSESRLPYESELIEEGSNGAYGRVYIITTDDAGATLEENQIAEDYYPADHQIEERGLSAPETEDDHETNDNNDAAPENNGTDDGQGNEVSQENGTVPENGDDAAPSQGDTPDADDGTSETPAEDAGPDGEGELDNGESNGNNGTSTTPGGDSLTPGMPAPEEPNAWEDK